MQPIHSNIIINIAWKEKWIFKQSIENIFVYDNYKEIVEHNIISNGFNDFLLLHYWHQINIHYCLDTSNK